MQADVDGGDGSGDAEADQDAGKASSADISEQILPESGQLKEVFGRAAAVERSARPFTDQVMPFIPLIEEVLQLARRRAELENSIGADVRRWNRTLGDAVRGLNLFLPTTAESAAANVLAVNLRGLDQLTTARARYAEYATTARWAEQTLGSGALTSWRVSLQANAQVEQLIKSATYAAAPHWPYYNELLRISRVQAGFADWIVQQDATSRLLGEVSGAPLARWRDYIGGLVTESTFRDVQASVLSGYTGLGILSADALTSGAEDTELVEASTSRIEADVLLPWEEGRLKLGRDLRDRLGAIDSSVPELLAGAWDDLERNGPAAVEKAAHCITEVLDRTLRAAAPDAEVREWHSQAGRPAAEWEGRERPPHSLRVKFLAQRLGGERTVVVAQFDSLATLHKTLRNRLQAIKHASAGDLTTVRSLLLVTEDLLALLFLSNG